MCVCAGLEGPLLGTYELWELRLCAERPRPAGPHPLGGRTASRGAYLDHRPVQQGPLHNP